MSNVLLIDNRMRSIEKTKLLNLGYKLVEIPTSTNTYFEISSHVDIFACKVNNDLVLEPTVYDVLKDKITNMTNVNIVKGSSVVKGKSPSDVAYNFCIIDNLAIGNFKYIDENLKKIIEKNNLKKVNINQGYSKCSIAVLDKNMVIVEDKSIEKVLKNNGLNVILLDNNVDIKLYKNFNECSDMKGFIGGCISKLDNYLFVSGDILKLGLRDEDRKSINCQIIDFKTLDIADYGGILQM